MAESQRLFALVSQEKDPAVARQKLAEAVTKRAEAAKKRLESQLKAAEVQTSLFATPWFRARK